MATLSSAVRWTVLAVLVFSLLSPTAIGGVGATADSPAEERPAAVETADADAVSYVRSVEEIRAHLLVAVARLEAGDREVAVHHAAEPMAEQWPVVSQELAATNATLERELESALERAANRSKEASAADYADLVRSEVLPLLDRAESAPVGAERLENATFNADVVAGLLERADAEYVEGVTGDGGVEVASDYRTARAFARRAETRYQERVADSLSDHAAEELDELFERLGTAMNETAGPERVGRLSSSIMNELAEYTGIEVESAGEGSQTIERIEADLHEAVEAYEADEPERAKSIVKETYLTNVEGIEGTLIESDPDLVESLEADFNEKLPGLIDEGAPVSEVREHVESMEGKLAEAEEILLAAEETDITITKGNETTATGTQNGADGTTGTTDTTTTTVPGFGVVMALLALVLGALGIYRNHH